MQRYAEAKLTTIPVAIRSQATGSDVSSRSFVFKSAAPKIIGIESKNENFAATRRDKPSQSPAVKVIPEREVPGINASACAKPITNASLSRIRAKPPRPFC